MRFSCISLLLLCFILTGCPKNQPSSSYAGHGATSVDPSTVEKFAPQALAPELSRQIERMLDVRSPGKGRITNDGRELFFSWNVTGRSQVWRAEVGARLPQQLTGGEEPTTLQALSPNEKYLVLSRDRAGEENPGLYLQKLTGGSLVKIYQKKGVQTDLQDISDDGRFIYFSANDIKPESRTLYRYEVSSKTIEKIFDEPGTWQIADHRGDEKLLLAKYLGALMIEFYELDLRSRKLSAVFGQGKNEEIWMSYGQSEGEFYVQTNMFGNFRRLYVMKEGSFNPITPEWKFDVESFGTDRQRTKLTVMTNEDGYFKTRVYDAKTLKPIDFPKIDADFVVPGGFSDNARYLTLGIEKSNEPSSTYVYDFEKKELRKWLAASSPEVDLDSFAPTTLDFYTARDGTKIPMLVRRPLACHEPCPVIVHFHGGPEGQSHPGFSTFAQNFVDAGFVFVEPNVRGSNGYGKDWLHSDDGPKRLNVITDIEDAALQIREKWKKGDQAPKIGVMGYSYGGYSTLMAMTRFAGAYDAGVALVGMSNLVSFLQNTAPYRRQLRISEYGDPEKDREALIKLSPLTYIEQVKAPLLIVQGVSDPRVPVGEALQIYESLKARGVPAELILFANEGHGSADRKNQVLEIGHTLGFFKTHLMPH